MQAVARYSRQFKTALAQQVLSEAKFSHVLFTGYSNQKGRQFGHRVVRLYAYHFNKTRQQRSLAKPFTPHRIAANFKPGVNRISLTRREYCSVNVKKAWSVNSIDLIIFMSPWITTIMNDQFLGYSYNYVCTCMCSEDVISPRHPMALRLSANLMVGIVRVHSQQTHYIYSESSCLLYMYIQWSICAI